MIIIYAIFQCNIVLSQTYTLDGYIKEIYNNDTIVAVGWIVSLNNTARKTMVDKNGFFSFNDLEAGDYTVNASMIGYAKRTYNVSIKNSSVTCNFNVFTDGREFVDEFLHCQSENEIIIYEVFGDALFSADNQCDANKLKKKFGVSVISLGCILPEPEDRLAARNIAAFDLLTKKHGKKWLKYTYDDLLGLETYMNFYWK